MYITNMKMMMPFYFQDLQDVHQSKSISFHGLYFIYGHGFTPFFDCDRYFSSTTHLNLEIRYDFKERLSRLFR